MSPTDVLSVTVWEDTGCWLAARLKGNLATYITQASLASVSYTVWDLTDNSQVVGSTSLTVSGVVYDTLQTTDPRWTVDSTGYNFAYSFPASCFPNGGRTYQLEIVFTPASGANFVFVARVRTQDLLSS